MFCKKCGNELSSGANFCEKCGCRIEVKKEKNEVDYEQYSADELFDILNDINIHYSKVQYDSLEFSQTLISKVVEKIRKPFLDEVNIFATLLYSEKYTKDEKYKTIEYLLKEIYLFFEDAEKICLNTEAIKKSYNEGYSSLVEKGIITQEEYSVSFREKIDNAYIEFAEFTIDLGVKLINIVSPTLKEQQDEYSKLLDIYRGQILSQYLKFWKALSERMKLYGCYINNDDDMKYNLKVTNDALLGSENDEVLSNLSQELFDSVKQNISQAEQNQGCYIATCVYGSYDCPEVWILRRFRDYRLAKLFFGKLFIKVYYLLSPQIVKSFGYKKSFRFFFKKWLDYFVKKLEAQGYENTPYKDPKW